MNGIEEARTKLVQAKEDLEGQIGQVDQALAALNGGKPKPRRGPGRPKGSTKATAARRPRRKRRGGTRADQAVKLVEKHPKGITASDIAKTMKIKPNYLYRVLGELEKENRVRKDGRTYYPVA